MNAGSHDEEVKLAILIGITGAALAMGLVKKLMNYIHKDERLDQMEENIHTIMRRSEVRLKLAQSNSDVLDIIEEAVRNMKKEENNLESWNTDLISESSGSQHE